MNNYRLAGDKVIFWGSFLSNWYPCKIKYKGLDFSSSEQLFMWMKAKHFKDEEIADEILKCKTPKEAKKLGRKVRGFDQSVWDDVKVKYMHDAIDCKFEQNPELKSKSMELGKSRYFVEGSPYDKIWGIGLDWQDVRAENELLWKGHNLLGELLNDMWWEYAINDSSKKIKLTSIFKDEHFE